MSRKKWLLLACVLLAVVIGFAICLSARKEIIYLEAPDPAFYPGFYDFVLDRPGEPTPIKNVGPIENYKDAVQKGLRLLKADNREDGGWLNEWLWRGKSITVFYVPEEDTWVLVGSCPCTLREGDPHWIGCHPVVIIESDGTLVTIGTY
jgi:hypothetical protein